MLIKRFNESSSVDGNLIEYNNKGDLKIGSIRLVPKQGLWIKDLEGVDWFKSTISYFNYKAGTTYWTYISEVSIVKLTDELKEFIYQRDKKEEFVKFTFCFDEKEKARLVHVEPQFERKKDYALITSCLFQFE